MVVTDPGSGAAFLRWRCGRPKPPQRRGRRCVAGAVTSRWRPISRACSLQRCLLTSFASRLAAPESHPQGDTQSSRPSPPPQPPPKGT